MGRNWGNPVSREEAIDMIHSLSGRDTPGIYRGLLEVCIRSESSFYVVTDVTFSSLEAEEIELLCGPIQAI